MAQPLKQTYSSKRADLKLTESQGSNQLKVPVLKRKEQLNTIIVDKNGQPDFLAINIFWDSLRSWYTPLEVHHSNGKITKHSKLRTKGIYSSAEKLAKVHGVSKETIRRKLAKLETLGFIQRSFEHKETVTTKSYNHRQIFVWKHTPHFFNPCGIEFSEVGIIKPQTNAKYIENKHNVIFGLQSQVTKDIEAKGGIHTPEDTKELREYSNKLEYRSSKSKFLPNSNNKLLEHVENTETKIPVTESVETIPIVTKKKLLVNKRRKVTNSERVTRYQKFKAYDKPKNLNEHYPLSQEDCCELQKRSDKAYNLNAMNEILLDMSRKPELQVHLFVSKAKFMCYMTKAYREEGREVDKANSPTFKIIKRRPQAEIQEIVTYNQRESYMKKQEDAAILNRTDYTQYRAKIAGQFPINLGYDLLKHMIDVKKKGDVFAVTMHKKVGLTDHYKQLLLNHANAVGGYAGVERLEFVGV